MRTNRNWDEVGDTSFPDMHKEWLECADELIERMVTNDPG
jgi:hypothetical protein